MGALLFLFFLIFIFIGMPVAMALGISSLIYFLANNIPLVTLAQKMYTGLDSFTLLCIPGFVLAGNIMNRGGITKRIVGFSNAMFGNVRGGLAIGNVLASMIFAGISGTALADTASIGGILIPSMKKEGYSPEYSAAITATSSTIGPIIPPSLPMIIVGTLSSISVSKLFVAGAIPGILLGLGMVIVAFIMGRKYNHPKSGSTTLKEKAKSFINAFWAIMLTVIILYGILGGIFTPTEASIIAVIYAFVIGAFVYKELKISKLPKIIIDSMVSTAAIMFLVGFANCFAWILTSEQIPQKVANIILTISNNKYVILLLINLLLIFVGCFMETIAALVILFPVLLAIVIPLGVNPIQFGVMVVLNLIIGLSTPPVGVCLFVASSIGKVSMAKVVRASVPFLLVCIIVLMLVTYVPSITLLLPNLLIK